MSNIITNPKTIENLVSWRMVETVIPREEAFLAALRAGKRLKFYFGIDPSNKELHLGHAPGLFFLKDMQALGHEVTLLVGDFTGMIGDPTGKDKTRKPLSRKQVLENARSYRSLAAKVLDFKSKTNSARLAYNSKWLSRLALEEFIPLASRFTVQQFLERDMFLRRLEKKQPISLHEFIYPLLQGYDSFALGVDAEIGGSDQLFNMIIGRKIVKDLAQKEKFVITLRLLIDSKTGKKMSKSGGSYVALTLGPEEMYGRIMALPDGMVPPCFELCTPMQDRELNSLKKKKIHPKELKNLLAKEIVSWVHNPQKAERAAREFERVFRQKTIPSKIPSIRVGHGAVYRPLEFLAQYGLVRSKSEAKRLFEEGAVEIDQRTALDWKSPWQFKKKTLIRVGKKRFLLVKVK